MKRIESPNELSIEVLRVRCSGGSIGLVPTMGYLHGGHLKLIEECRQENDLVIVSIYVNPAQFGPDEDFARYPRDLDRDLALAGSADTDIVFVPDDTTMYPDGVGGQQVWVDPGELGRRLEGVSRPSHFRGVATVVLKLLRMANPDRAYFGQKDAQQAVVLSRMAHDLCPDVAIRTVATVREPDGLAMSSRNNYLSPRERSEATALKAALDRAARAVESGIQDVEAVTRMIVETLTQKAPTGRIDYIAIVDKRTLLPIAGLIDRPVLLALAVRFGATRLIDNLVLSP